MNNVPIREACHSPMDMDPAIGVNKRADLAWTMILNQLNLKVRWGTGQYLASAKDVCLLGKVDFLDAAIFGSNTV